MVKGNAETRINDSESFFCNILIRVKIENGGRKAKVKYIDTSSISNGKFGELEKLGNYQWWIVVVNLFPFGLALREVNQIACNSSVAPRRRAPFQKFQFK